MINGVSPDAGKRRGKSEREAKPSFKYFERGYRVDVNIEKLALVKDTSGRSGRRNKRGINVPSSTGINSLADARDKYNRISLAE